MEKSTPRLAVETFKSLGDKAFIGQSSFGVLMTWIMLIFVIVAIVFVGRVIRSEEQKAQLAQLHQNTELRADAFNMRVSSDAERITQLMLNLDRHGNFEDDIMELRTRARSLMAARSEILEIFFLTPDGTVIASFASPTPLGDLSLARGEKYERVETDQAIQRSHRNDSISFSDPYALPLEGSPFVDLVTSYRWKNDEVIVAARLSLWMLLRETDRNFDSSEFRISLLHNDLPIVSATTDSKRKTITYKVPLYPLHNVYLQVSSYAHGLMTQNILFWVISALGIFLVMTLGGLIRFNIRQNQIETALRAETALRKAMADSQLSGLRVTDMHGRIVYANTTFCRMLKYDSAEDLIGQVPPYSFWPKNEALRLQELTDGLLHGRIPTSTYEFSPVCADGSTFYALIHVTPLLAADGKQLGWLGSLTDISEIQQAQEKLAAAHERFTRVLESMQSAISVVDPQTNTLLFTNTAYDNHFGQSNEAHLTISSVLQELEIDASQGQFMDIFVEKLDRWFAVQEKLITWTDRSSVRLQIALDISVRRRNEMLLAEQQARSEQNSRLVTMGEMASSLAHELNQPLAAISNYAFVVKSLMKKVGVPAEHEMFHSVERIDAQAERAAGIIRRIRSFTKRSDPNMELNSINTLVDEVLELARMQARRHNAKLEHFIAPDVQNVWCDAIMIEQVLLNLIKNGIEASALPGQIPTVTMTIYRDTNQNVVFEVADNGSGITDEDKERLFDPFFTTKSSGMGMGLNICRTIVELHHGRLTISDNIGQGTIFTLTLPSKEFVSS